MSYSYNSICQSFNKQRVLTNIYNFYHYLNDKDTVTIDKYVEMFGSYGLEEEEEFIYRECTLKKMTERECNKDAEIRLSNTKKYSSLTFKKLKEDFLLYNNIPYSIDSVIRNSVCFDQGVADQILVELTFPNRDIVTFVINKYTDEKPLIIDIFLNNGESIFNKMGTRGTKRLEMKATIKDADGFSNVRKEPDLKAAIIAKVYTGDTVVYFPNYTQSWWNIQLNGKDGYIHESRLNPIGKIK